MTVEELKAEAKKMGYAIIPNKREKLLPCICGCNRREHWYGPDGDKARILKCMKCGREVSGRTDKEAIRNWNKMIKELENE